MKSSAKSLRVSKKYVKVVGNSTSGSLVFVEAKWGIQNGLTSSINFATKHPKDSTYVLLTAKVEVV